MAWQIKGRHHAAGGGEHRLVTRPVLEAPAETVHHDDRITLVKQNAEVKLLRQAAAICDRAIEAVRDELCIGMSEQQIAGIAEHAARDAGSEFAWTFTHDGRTTQARGPAEAGIHLAADTLAARYAPASTRSSSNLTLRVDGMDDLADYSGLLAYLRELSLVRGVEVESLDGTVITLRVVVRGDRELLGRIAALDGRLQPGSRGAEEGPAAVDFVYAP